MSAAFASATAAVVLAGEPVSTSATAIAAWAGVAGWDDVGLSVEFITRCSDFATDYTRRVIAAASDWTARLVDQT